MQQALPAQPQRPRSSQGTDAPPKPFAKGIGHFVRQRKWALALAGALSAVGALLGLLPLYFVYLITLELFGSAQPNQSLILSLAGASGVVALLRGLAVTASTHIAHIAAYDILYDTRIELARKLGSLPLGYFSENNTGTVKKVIHEDVEQMEEGIAHIIPDAVGGIVTPVLTLIMLFGADWRMAIATLLTILVATAVYALMLTSSAKGMGVYQTLVGKMNAAVIQYINGMKVIKAFTQTNISFEKLRGSIDEMSNFYNDFQKVVGARYAAVLTLVRASLLTILPAGVYFFLGGSLSVPTLVLFLVLGIGFNRPIFQMFIGLSYAGYQVSVAAKRVAQVLAEPSLSEPAHPKKPTTTEVSFKHVTFGYGHKASPEHLEGPLANDKGQVTKDKEQLVLNNVSLHIPQGSVTALVGPSGAGKTTMARLIPRFWEVTSGEVAIGGVNIREIGSEHLMSLVSFVFQDVFLFNDTVAANIRIGKPNATDEEVVAAAQAARCHEFVTQELSDGYSTQIGENGSRLSGGQRQRLSIARAILKDAPIVVLDEATAFVDPENESQIQEALGALMRAGKTLIIVAHRLSTIIGADQIVVVNEGAIEAIGKHNDLLTTNALYKNLWDAHTQAGKWEFGPEPMTSDERRTTSDKGQITNDTHLQNPYAHLSSEDSLPRAVYKLSAGVRPLLWRGVAAKLMEGVFVALPSILLFLVLLQVLSPQPNAGLLWLYVGIACACFVGQYMFNRLGLYALLQLDTGIQRNLRVFLADYMRRLPLGFFTRRDVGSIDALFTTHLQFLESRLAIDLLLIAVVTPLLVFINTLFVDWRMALAMGAGLPIAFVALGIVNNVFARVWRKQSDARTLANARIVEYIQGIPVLRAFNLTGGRRDHFQKALDDYRIASQHTTTELSPANAGYMAAVEVGFAVLLVVGALLFNAGSLSAERFLLCMILASGFYAPLMAMGDFLGIQRIVQNAIRNVNEFLKTPILPEPAQPQHPRGFEIVFEGVSFDYASDKGQLTNDKTLNNVTFTIPERTICALVGPSGSGKTTITNLIARFWDATQGHVRVGGVDVRDQTVNGLLSQMTMVFQDVYLFNDSIKNNIKLGQPNASDDDVIVAAKAAQCHDFIVAMPNGYDTVVAEGGSTLSGGQKQRISIARAILKDAPIVLLDEATASVDPENEQLIQQAFIALAAHKTLVIIAHQLTTIQKAHQILVVNRGHIQERGTHAELLAQDGLYARFWHERQKARTWKLA